MVTFICFHRGNFESVNTLQDLCQNRGRTGARPQFEIVPFWSRETCFCDTTDMAHWRGIKCIKKDLILHWGHMGGCLCHSTMAQISEKFKKWPKRLKTSSEGVFRLRMATFGVIYFFTFLIWSLLMGLAHWCASHI